MNQPFLDDLNPDQYEAASCLGHCLTIAAPGSGKTKMLAAKAAFLLSKGATVVAVTFTRDAAYELLERIVKQAGPDAMPRLLVGTFHSLDLLMANPKRRMSMGAEIIKHLRSTERPWSIIRESKRRSFVQRAIMESGVGSDVSDATSIIEAIKADEADKAGKPVIVEKEPKFVDAQLKMCSIYCELLRRHDLIDFQDILLNTNAGLINKTITPLKADYILLDEFQDTDLAQYKWTMLHAKAGAIITAVGDDDQSIYGFRRALGYEAMQRLGSDLRAKQVVLGVNYRSHSEILARASHLIEQNGNRMDKALVAHKGKGGSVRWDRFAGKKEEAEACLKEISQALNDGQTVGVLARMNSQLQTIQAALLGRDIKFNSTPGESILNRPEASVVMAVLSCLIADNAKDMDELLGWCGVDEDDIDRIKRHFGANFTSTLLQNDKAVFTEVGIKENTKQTLREITKCFPPWRSMLKAGSFEFVLARIDEFLTKHAKTDGSIKLINTITQIFTPPNGVKQTEASITAKIAAIRRMMDEPDSRDKDNEVKHKLSLMTAHGSKGLEFDTVWLLGAEQGAFPDDSGSLQEERRLFYVAMTRARKTLRISCSGKREISDFVIDSKLIRVGQLDYHELTN